MTISRSSCFRSRKFSTSLPKTPSWTSFAIISYRYPIETARSRLTSSLASLKSFEIRCSRRFISRISFMNELFRSPSTREKRPKQSRMDLMKLEYFGWIPEIFESVGSRICEKSVGSQDMTSFAWVCWYTKMASREWADSWKFSITVSSFSSDKRYVFAVLRIQVTSCLRERWIYVTLEISIRSVWIVLIKVQMVLKYSKVDSEAPWIDVSFCVKVWTRVASENSGTKPDSALISAWIWDRFHTGARIKSLIETACVCGRVDCLVCCRVWTSWKAESTRLLEVASLGCSTTCIFSVWLAINGCDPRYGQPSRLLGSLSSRPCNRFLKSDDILAGHLIFWFKMRLTRLNMLVV